MTTSLILTAQEWQFALCGEGDIGELDEKGLAKRDEDGSVTLGPELRLIVEEYDSAVPQEVAQRVIALRGKRFCMLIEPYQYMEDALKISLYKDNAALQEALSERGSIQDG